MPIELYLKNVRCFKEVTIPLDERCTVIIGENGSGKTTIAEMLASFSDGEREGLEEFPLRYGTKSGEAALRFNGRARASWRSGGKRTRMKESFYLFAYGRYRRVRPEKEEGSTSRKKHAAEIIGQLFEDANRERTITLHRPDGRLFERVEESLEAIYESLDDYEAYAKAWGTLQESLKALGHGIEGLEMVERKYDYEPMLLQDGQKLPLKTLSDGYQAVLVVVLDLFFRYIALFAELENPMNGEAVVVIDEVELHLHPRWQRVVLDQLLMLFPNTRFILTTHSPAVLQSAVDEGHSVLVLHRKADHVALKPLSKSMRGKVRGAGIDALLLHDSLFGGESRYSPCFEKDEDELVRLRKKVEDGEATKADIKRLRKLIDQFEGMMLKEEERRGEGAFMGELARLKIAFIKDLAREAGKQMD